MGQKKKILIIQIKFIGDVLASSVMANEIKKVHPDWEVHFFCYTPALSVLQENPAIDKIISFEKDELKSYPRFYQYLKQVRKEKYDIVIDPYAKLESFIVTKFAAPKMSISYNRTMTRLLYTHPLEMDYVVEEGKCRALADRMHMLHPFLGNRLQENYPMQIFLTDKEREEGRMILKENDLDLGKKTLMLGVIGSGWDKTWPLDYTATMIQEIQANFDCNLLFNYIPSQQEMVDELLSYLPNLKNIYPNVLGKNVREFLKIMANCDAYIGNEGGGINMSKGLSKPTFSIYSPHKTPISWGCMEDLTMHRNVYLKDLLPDVYRNSDKKDRLENPEKYYRQMLPEWVVPPIVEFIKEEVL